MNSIRSILIRGSHLEGHAIIKEHEAILRGIRVGPAVIADAVAGVEEAVGGKGDRNTGRPVAIVVLSAVPVGHEADFLRDGLFISENHSSAVTVEGREVDLAGIRDNIGTSRQARTVVAGLDLLREVAVKQSPSLVQLSACCICTAAVQRLMKECAAHERESLVIILVELPLEVRLDVSAGPAGRDATGIAALGMERREVDAKFSVVGAANNKTRIVQIGSGSIVRSGSLREKVEFEICFPLVNRIARRNVENR